MSGNSVISTLGSKAEFGADSVKGGTFISLAQTKEGKVGRPARPGQRAASVSCGSQAGRSSSGWRNTNGPSNRAQEGSPEYWNMQSKSPTPKRSAVRLIQPPVPPVGAVLLSDAAWAETAQSLKLSGRQLEIVRNIFDNHTEATIASNLRVSEHTIHSHLNRVFQKLRVTTRVQLVLRVIQEILTLTKAQGSCLPPICCNYGNRRCPINGRGST
jgi:DNA-binding CsgD family transcriptional regulator